MYLIRVNRKSGSILTIWFDNLEEATELINWSISDDDGNNIQIAIFC